MKRTLEQLIRDNINFSKKEEETYETLSKQLEPLAYKKRRLRKALKHAAGLGSWFDISTFDKEVQDGVVAYAARFDYASFWLRMISAHEKDRKASYSWLEIKGVPSDKVVHLLSWRLYDCDGRWKEDPEPPTIYYDTRKEGPEYEKLLAEIDARERRLEEQLAKIPKLNERYQLEIRELLEKKVESGQKDGEDNIGEDTRVHDFCEECICVCYDEVVEQYLQDYECD